MSIGEYEIPKASLTQWRARATFLNLLPQLAPREVKELSGTLLQSLQMAERGGTPFLNVLSDLINCSERGITLNNIYSPAQVIFYQQLIGWADRYNLNARWLIEHFVQMLDWWNQFPQERGKNMSVGLGHSEDWFGEPDPFRFEYPEWHYRELSEHEYRQAVEQAFMKELKLYLARRSSQAVASGDQSVKRTRKRGEIDFIVRMEWFVLYQVGGLTTQKILERYTQTLRDSATPKQVSDSLKEMSALIGLPLRPAQRGRPKKQQ